MRKCQKCGAEVEKDDTYCPDCGEKLAKEAKKVTVWTILKIIGAILLFIIFVNIFKQNPPIAIFLLILFLMWTGILNSILKKLFNVEISTGVKIVITAGLILLLFGVSQTQQIKVMPVEERTPEFRAVEPQDLYEFIEKMNRIIESKDHESWEVMLKKEMISREVFEDVIKVFKEREDISISLKPLDHNFYGDQADIMVMVVIKTDSGAKREGVRFFFEKTGSGWKLFRIDPNLLNIKLRKSFEGEVAYKIEKVQKPIIAISDTKETSIGYMPRIPE